MFPAHQGLATCRAVGLAKAEARRAPRTATLRMFGNRETKVLRALGNGNQITVQR